MRKIVSDDWARPIFNLDTDYKHLTREERQQRDADQATLKRQTSLTSKTKTRSADVDLPFASNRADDDLDNDDCPRARVPRPSNKDYLVRPVSTVEYSEKRVRISPLCFCLDKTSNSSVFVFLRVMVKRKQSRV